ncbi:MAG: AarF/ABC1/UbiB kinase family protein, partial [Salibacteraceae bacterium]
SEKDQATIMGVFGSMFQLVGQPFYSETFDFSNDSFFEKIYSTGMALSKDSSYRNLSARGSRHFIYFNRTYFGLYQLLHQLKANIHTGQWTFIAA